MGKRRANTSTGLLDLPSHQTPRNRRVRKPRGFFARALINSSVLYVLYWVLYACPSGVPGRDSPQVCHRYHSLKGIITTKALPVVQPYYEEYAGPYLSKGKPYYEQANTVYKEYAKPVMDKTSSIYGSYIHPVAAKGANAARQSYASKLGPTVDRHVTTITKRGKTQYEHYVGKYLKNAHVKYDKVVAPYVVKLQQKSEQAYEQLLVPAYYKFYPYGRAVAAQISALYASHVHPRLLQSMHWLLEFLDTKVFTTMRRVYYLYVEPQKDKIFAKLFQLKISTGFAKLEKPSADAIESAVSLSVLSGVKLSTRVSKTMIAGETISVEASAPSVNANLQQKIQHGVIDDLLSIAENNIAKEGLAAEKVLLEQLDDILPAMVKKEEILCEDYLKQLEKVTVEEVESIEQRIIKSANTQSNKGRATTDIAEELRPYFVKSGKAIHSQAVEVKAHISTVLESLQTKVLKATYVVYEQVLAESQRQKREPEHKLRYEMHGVSRKELKRLDALDDQVKAIEHKLNSAADRTLKDYSKTLSALLTSTEKKVENLAGGAANKLHTLRNIGPKKITVLDASEHFGHGYLPVGVMLGAQAIYNQISTGIYGEAEPTPELHQVVFHSVKSYVADLPNEINTDAIASAASHAASLATEKAGVAASVLSSVVADIDSDALASSASSAASVASVQAANAYAAASSVAGDIDVGGGVYSAMDKAHEYVGEQAAGIADSVSSAILGTPAAFTDRVASKVSVAIHGTETPLAESLANRAQQVYDAASQKIDSVVHGTPVPLTDSIASKASEALYGSQLPAAESVKSRVADAFENLRDKATDFIHGSEDDLSSAAVAASKTSSSLASIASKSTASLKSAASTASILAARSLSSASSLASKSSKSLEASAESSRSLASKSLASVSSVASRSSESLKSSASSVASKSSSSASVEAAKSLAEAASSAKSAIKQETPVIQSVVDKAWEDYANAKEAVVDVIDTVRERVEL